MPRDYYIILGVSRNAELNKIKRAYRKAIKRFHPDLTRSGEDTEKFMEIKEAYDTLGNEEKRRKYDETLVRQRSVRDQRYRYIRNFPPGAGFATLNRYKEKCFLVKPLMRRLHEEGKLTGPSLELMKPFPEELLYDLVLDPYEVRNLAESSHPEHREALLRLRAALDTWMTETGDLGGLLEPPEIVVPFEKEMHDWFGTPDWYQAK